MPYHSTAGLYKLHKVFVNWQVSAVTEVPITCKCGHETKRSLCHCEQSETEYLTFKNYFCPECGAFIRCDSFAKPLPKKQKAESEGDSDNDDNE